MNETDLSDEAYLKYIKGKKNVYPRDIADEWRRRAQIQIETQASQHIEALSKAMEQNVRLLIKKMKLDEQLEKERREAISFAIGRVLYADGIAPEIEVDEAYRAFLQEREGKHDS